MPASPSEARRLVYHACAYSSRGWEVVIFFIGNPLPLDPYRWVYYPSLPSSGKVRSRSNHMPKTWSLTRACVSLRAMMVPSR